MPSHKFELTDVSSSETNLTSMHEGRGGGGGGCYLSTVLGFVLVLLAAAVAVGVGIIVHFAGGNREVVCKCDVSSAASAEAIRQQCFDMASTGNSQLCQKCPGSPVTALVSTTSTPKLTSTPTTPSTKVKDVRLPTSLYPVHYNVEIQTYMNWSDPANFTFKGQVKIWIRCVKATNNVTLHINELKVVPDTLRFTADDPTAGDPVYESWREDKDRQFLIVMLSKDMQIDRTYILELTYTSRLVNGLSGLYYSTYTRNGNPVYLATTQFQPTDARKAFPCFDEPALKATYNITLVRPSNMISISNTPIINNSTTVVESGVTYVKDVYETTPKMSSYLLAFIICDFTYTSGRTSNGILYRAWSRPEEVNSTLYALDTGMKIITYFEEFFQIRFPLPKQDMIAIPDFAAGAMENWGLITYRETAMLYKEGVSHEANRERVAVVVSHELAHQWFGDLVSPAWWDDLWLNEGFASFVEYLGVDFVHSKWKMFDTFVISELQDAMAFDGLVSSHPLYVPVGHPDEINEIFDAISYSKGASVIRMMRHFIGFDTFQRGMKKYLTSKQYDAATHNDLWSALSQQAREDGKNIDVKDIMDTWTLQMNYPVVTVTRTAVAADSVTVSQARFLENKDAPELGKYVSPYNYTWNIPLTFTTSLKQNFNQTDQDIKWLWKNETTKQIRLESGSLPLGTTGWLLANVEQNGYYRVSYELANWEALAGQLKTNHLVIPVINRAQIINDAWNLAKSNQLGLETAFKVIDYLDNEREYVPWAAARRELLYVNRMLAVNVLYGPYQKFMQNKVNSSYQYFGLNNTNSSHTDVAARGLIVAEACRFGIQNCLDTTHALYQQWMDNPSNNPIDPNLRTIVYCNAISAGGWEEWSFGLRMYGETSVASEKVNLLAALSCATKPWILNNYMAIILEDNSPIRKQDALSVVSYISSNTVGRLLAWNFFRGNYNKLKDLFGNSFFAWTNVIDSVTRNFNTPFELEEVKAFRASQMGNFGSGERAFEQAVEKVASNIKWMQKNEEVIRRFLTSTGYITS